MTPPVARSDVTSEDLTTITRTVLVGVAAASVPGPAKPIDARDCEVCGARLTPLQIASKARTCGARPCEWTLRTTPKHARCTLCDRPLLTGRELTDRVCASETCQRRHFIATARLVERQRMEALLAHARVRRAAEAAAVGEDPERFPIVVIPSFPERRTRLPAPRRKAFAANLARQIALAFERGPDAAPPVETDAPPAPDVAAALGAACATCRGHCCRHGGERAYLGADRMQRHLAEHPEHGPDDVLNAYLVHVGRHTIDGSCVYHGARGCTLPREMRSDTCNRFYCGPLHDLKRALATDGPPRAFLASAEGSEVGRTRFIGARAQPGSAPVS